MTRTNQEVLAQAGEVISLWTWSGMSPAQGLQLMHSWLKKVAAAALPCFCPFLRFAGYEPKLFAWAYSVKELLVPWTDGADNAVKLVRQQTSDWTA